MEPYNFLNRQIDQTRFALCVRSPYWITKEIELAFGLEQKDIHRRLPNIDSHPIVPAAVTVSTVALSVVMCFPCIRRFVWWIFQFLVQEKREFRPCVLVLTNTTDIFDRVRVGSVNLSVERFVSAVSHTWLLRGSANLTSGKRTVSPIRR